MREETIQVDLYDPSLPELLTLKMGDTTRLTVIPTSHGEPFSMAGCTVYLCALRPDSTAIIQRTGITTANGRVVIDLDARILAKAGTVFCEIMFYREDDLISTFRLPLAVSPSAVSDEPESPAASLATSRILFLLERNLALHEFTEDAVAGHLPVVSQSGGWEDSGKTVTDFAAAEHTHTGFAAADHTHTGFAAADHTHTGFAAASHSHTSLQPKSVTGNAYFTATTVEGILTEIGQTLSGVDSALAALL